MLPFYLLVLAQFMGTISGQACRTSQPALRDWIPTTWRTLIDNADYENLITANGWVARDVDGDGTTYSQLGGVCTRTLMSCPSNFMISSSENNWVISPYINYASAREVIYNVTVDLTLCFAGCQRYVTGYLYDTDSPSEQARVNTGNYRFLTGSDTSSRFSQPAEVIEVIEVARPPGSDGFYFAIRATGTCSSVLRVIIYYKVCLAMVKGLVIFPEVPLPPRSGPDEAYSASCAPNSHSITSLMVDITSSAGNCTERDPRGAQCECNAGYYRLNDTDCEGKYWFYYFTVQLKSIYCCTYSNSNTISTVKITYFCQMASVKVKYFN